MKLTQEQIRDAVAANMDRATKLLCDIIATPSLPGDEDVAMKLAAMEFAKIADVETIALNNSIRDDKDYSDPVEGIDYDGRSNLRIVFPGAKDDNNLLLNSHIDTVPPSQGQENPYSPKIVDGCLYGRGACDAKGQVATIFLAMAALKTLNVRLENSLITHVVVEEEVGGNGTLAMTRRGEKAAGCVVLEPTEMKILSSIRGAVWFRINVKGCPGHSGQAGKTQSALKTAMRIIEILEYYHSDLLERSRGDEMFDKYENPMPLTIGKLHAGNWPATAPGEAVLEGVLGLLPNKTATQVMTEMQAAITDNVETAVAENIEISFMYRHDASVCPKESPLVQQLGEAVSAVAGVPVIDAMTASCDAWFYNNQLEMPTVVFGGGSLSVAHSNRECMGLDDLAKAAEVIATMAIKWCGVR